jgi:hypothetical protein
MKEKREILVSNQILQLLLTDKSKAIHLLNIDLTNIHNNKICSLLSAYHCHERGTAISFEIDPKTLTVDNLGHGSFFVDYTVDYYEGCKDRDYLNDDNSMEIDIMIDLQSGTAILTGATLPEREPDGID